VPCVVYKPPATIGCAPTPECPVLDDDGQPEGVKSAHHGPIRMDPQKTRLSTREWKVACLVAEGLTNREIAQRLFISERTAESHLERIRRKLGFHHRSEVAAWIARGADYPADGTVRDSPARRTADERQRLADERERSADKRQRLADERERRADSRDALADQRDAALDERQRGLDQRGIGELRRSQPSRNPED